MKHNPIVDEAEETSVFDISIGIEDDEDPTPARLAWRRRLLSTQTRVELSKFSIEASESTGIDKRVASRHKSTLTFIPLGHFYIIYGHPYDICKACQHEKF